MLVDRVVLSKTVDLEALVGLIKGPPVRSRNAVTLALNLLSRGSRFDGDALAEAEADSIAIATEAWGAAVSHDDFEVRRAGLDAVVQWCSEAPPEWAAFGGDKESLHVPFAEKRRQQEAAGRWKTVLRSRAEGVCKSAANLAMFNLLDSDRSLERQMSLAAFGRILGTVGGENELKELLEPLVVAKGRDLRMMRRKAALTSALFLADGDLGVWLLGKDAAVSECLALIASGDEIGQAIAAETLCLAASKETGRSLLAPVVEAGTLDALLDSPNARARSAAASTLAKLGVASKALTSDSSDTGRLLNTAMLLLRGAEDAASADLGAEATAAQQKFAESATVTTERAVEVLAALITKSAVKDELAHGSGRCAQALPRLCAVARDGRGAGAYGLAHIFASLSITNKEVQERLLKEREMEITPEQLAELQRITKQKGESEEDTDNPERCGWRIRQIVQADGIRALVRLTDGASEKTKEQVALALRQIVVEPSVRGSLVQQGGYRAAIALATGEMSSPSCVRDATWCVAKALVTTNPSVLTSAQRMGSIGALLRLCRDHRAPDLAHFECLMALTNVASFSEETKARIAGEKGIRTLEYLQFSDHELVRRAATECLTNMMPHPSMIEHLRDPEKLKLWCAFAGDYETDLPTSRAAAGALAMAAGTADEQLQATLLDSKALAVLVTLLASGSPELAHRAAVGIGYLTDSPQAVERFSELGAREVLQKVAKKKSPEWTSAASAASDANRALVEAAVAAATAASSPQVSDATAPSEQEAPLALPPPGAQIG